MSCTLHTNLGDLKVELFCEDTPRAAENFLALCASGYYDGTSFHRNIKGFMVQGSALPAPVPVLVPDRRVDVVARRPPPRSAPTRADLRPLVRSARLRRRREAIPRAREEAGRASGAGSSRTRSGDNLKVRSPSHWFPYDPRSRGERRSLRTLPGVSLRPPLAFDPRPRRLSTPPDAFELHPDVASYGPSTVKHTNRGILSMAKQRPGHEQVAVFSSRTPRRRHPEREEHDIRGRSSTGFSGPGHVREKTPVDEMDRPLAEIRVNKVTIHANPLAR